MSHASPQRCPPNRGKASFYHFGNGKVDITYTSAPVNPERSVPIISASFDISAGLSLQVCVRAVYKCSWSWSCSTITLEVDATPSLSVALSKDSGIAFVIQDAHVNVNAHVSGLPFPFSLLGDALLGTFAFLFQTLLNAILAACLDGVRLVIAPPHFSVYNQSTTLYFNNFDPFGFVRSSNLQTSRLDFAAYAVDVDFRSQKRLTRIKDK
jgi:hypothetical protein